MNVGTPYVRKKHEEFIEQYKKHVEVRVNSAIYNASERDDVKQFVYLELIKSYKNCRRYADWHNIVLSIIKRRISDYKKKMQRTPLYHFSSTQDDENAKSHNDLIDSKLLERGMIESNTTSRFENSDFLENLWKMVSVHSEEFTEWELDYIGALFDAYDNDIGFETEDERIILMGFDPESKEDVKHFRKQVRKFTQKLKEIIKHDKMQ